MRKGLHILLAVLLYLSAIVESNAQNFVAPFGYLPDPNIVYHNGWYYYSGTIGSGISMKKARTLEGLKHTPLTRIFSGANGGPCCDYWAPEMFRINNKWYIYYTAKYQGEGQRNYVIENSSDDPMTGTWIDRGKIADPQNDYWGIDGTILETNGQLYFIWSGVEKESDGDKPQRTYIARMSNPWTLNSGRVLLASPELSWERDGRVNEGQYIIKNDGKIFLTYSANGCWTENYLIGTLYMTEGGDPLNPNLWTKHPTPLFTKLPGRDIYGPGHHSFFKSPDGKETWFAYHASPNPGGACDMGRTSRAQRLSWDVNGFPSFGIPDPTGAWLTPPSGEPMIPSGLVLPNGIYKITPTSSTNKVLDIAGCSPVRGANVTQWQDNGLDCQKWHIIATPDGYYSINAVKGGLALDVENCSVNNAANVRMWTPSGGDCQKWIFKEVSPGVYSIASKRSGKVLDIQFGGDNNGANLQIYTYLGNAQQHFKVELIQSYSAVSWESHNFPGRFIRHQDGRGKINSNVSPQEEGEWRMVPGLAGVGVSFQSVTNPNYYLRHAYREIRLNENSGSTTFREDATFYIRQGLADASKVSFESFNFPDNYIRHKNGLLYLETVNNDIGFNDATWGQISVPDRNKPNVATLYVNCSHAGSNTSLPIGDYNRVALEKRGVQSNTLSSLSIARGYKVELYEGDNFTGNVRTIQSSVNCLDQVDFDNKTSSVKILPAGDPNLSGIYFLKNRNSSFFMDLVNGNTNDGASLAQSEHDRGLNQQFSFHHIGHGVYRIMSERSEKSLNVKDAGKANGVPIQTSSYDNTLHQQFIVYPTGDGYYQFIALHSAKSVKIVNGSVNEGAGIELWNNHNQFSSHWKLISLNNQSPVVEITDPNNNAVFDAGSTVRIEAIASDPDGYISKVEFYSGDEKIGERTSTPWTIDWENVSNGNYVLTVKATDGMDATSVSEPIVVAVSGVTGQISLLYELNNNVYPNPGTGVYYITTKAHTAEVYANSGEYIGEHNITDGKLDLSAYNSGLYLVKMLVEDKVFYSKIIKQD